MKEQECPLQHSEAQEDGLIAVGTISSDGKLAASMR